MRKILCATLTAVAIIPSQPALAAPVTPAVVASPTCSRLTTDYDNVEKSIARTMADGIADNSAPRETNRELRDSNALARASITVTLMQAYRCKLPDHAPSVARYLSPALKCATDSINTPSPDSCKMENWTSSEATPN